VRDPRLMTHSIRMQARRRQLSFPLLQWRFGNSPTCRTNGRLPGPHHNPATRSRPTELLATTRYPPAVAKTVAERARSGHVLVRALSGGLRHESKQGADLLAQAASHSNLTDHVAGTAHAPLVWHPYRWSSLAGADIVAMTGTKWQRRYAGFRAPCPVVEPANFVDRRRAQQLLGLRTLAGVRMLAVDSVETLLDRINSDERLPRALRPRVGKVSAIEPTWFGLNPNATKGRRIEVGGGDRQAGRQPEMPVIFRAGFHYCVIR